MSKKFNLVLIFIMVSVNSFCDNLFSHKWASYTTYFQTEVERAKNIHIAVEKLDGFILHPKAEFSYNETVTWQIPRDQLRYAPAIVDGKLLPAAGGGLCQVSSTLYATVLSAGLHITERQNHSSPVGYISMGLDATVSSTEGIDLKFTNNTDFPFIIKAEIKKNTLTITLASSVPLNRKISLSTNIIETNSTQIKTITTRKTNFKNGVTETEIISHSTYLRVKPQQP
jgi:vancomycin resistance protein YoaR